MPHSPVTEAEGHGVDLARSLAARRRQIGSRTLPVAANRGGMVDGRQYLRVGEGVDVPELDAVLFADPRDSARRRVWRTPSVGPPHPRMRPIEAVDRCITEIWSSQSPPQTLLGVGRLALRDMWFEVDAVAGPQ